MKKNLKKMMKLKNNFKKNKTTKTMKKSSS